MGIGVRARACSRLGMGFDAWGLGLKISAQLHAVGDGDIREEPGKALLCILGD